VASLEEACPLYTGSSLVSKGTKSGKSASEYSKTTKANLRSGNGELHLKRFSLVLAFLCLLLTLGAGRLQPPASSHGGPVQEYVSLKERLRVHGIPAGEVQQPFFSVKGPLITVNGEQVQVYECPDAASANAAATHISPDGGIIGNTAVAWIAPPPFY
jgi:hypothetical protein